MPLLIRTVILCATLTVMLWAGASFAQQSYAQQVTQQPAQQPAQPGADTAGAVGVIATYVSAWNVHDMSALAAVFAEDAAFVNPLGGFWKGRAAIEAGQTERHKTVFQSSTMTNDTSDVRFLAPDIAVLHYQWTLTGISGQDGSPVKPWHGITTFVVTKTDGRWLIEAAQGTLIQGTVSD